MFTITRTQYNELSLKQLERFLRDLHVNIIEKFSPKIWNNDIDFLRIQIKQLCQFCMKYGILTESDVEDFILSCISNQAYYSDIAKNRHIIDILSYPDRSPSDKICHLTYFFDSGKTIINNG